ncbi:MAG: glucoamylase family protein [Lapillicoccus sp.]
MSAQEPADRLDRGRDPSRGPSRPSRRQVIGAVAGAAGLLAAGLPAQALGSAATSAIPRPLPLDRARARRWAADTWHGLVAMTDPRTGLVADNSADSLRPSDQSGWTSPTNIGGMLWSTVVARELGLISRGESTSRLIRTLQTIDRMPRHEPSGMYYNWYSPQTAEKLTAWPVGGGVLYPFLSSVDNGWLGAALRVVMSSDRAAGVFAGRIFRRMRWDMFYNADAPRPGGLIHGGFWDAPPAPGQAYLLGNHIGVGPDVYYTTNYYDTTVSETRITSYLGIITGQIPARQYFAMWRTFPSSCDWSWQESQPAGVTRTYLGTDVYEGAYAYRGMRIVPGWGGSMFEELMPDVFVPEATWAPRSWGLNHPLHVRAQREHGLLDARYGYWGFSPSSDPFGGYREYGVDLLGMNPTGYYSDEQNTNPDIGFGTCRAATNPTPTFGDGVVTPHASFLAMMHEPDEAYTNQVNIEDRLRAYASGGFLDAVATRSGTLSHFYFSLDQAMVMGALGNVLADDIVRTAFCGNDAERLLRPVIGMEVFGSSG